MSQKKYLVEKRNVLNEIISREFTLQELRLFSIYLARINAREVSTRVVRFPLEWFYEIMDLKRVKICYLKAVTRDLLTKVVQVPTVNGGYNQFTLFKRCKIDKDDSGAWFFEIDASDDGLQLMFKYKRDYFYYELWNVLNLESTNQFRMYEVLKQYEYKKERIISVDELKALLGISRKEYPRWNNFRARVLNSCQAALEAKTDISFTYEVYKRGGRGGKIESLRFRITKNDNYVNQLNLEELLGTKVIEDIKQEPLDASCLDFITESLTNADKQAILQAAEEDIEVVRKIYEIAKNQNVDSLVGFLIGMIKKDKFGEVSEPISRKKQNKFANFTSTREYNFDELERLETEQLIAATSDKLDWAHLEQTQLV